ncbi:MAG: HAD-IIB family hydrolase [Candidatus Magasanikbacteria bacterium]|nr:HAD-IIB family hydrolase [Candidatus Magasanikbacteria bacterium]
MADAKLDKNLKAKQLIIFDLDGTLTKSKARVSRQTAALFSKLLQKKFVAVVGGGKYGQFKKQLLAKLEIPKPLLANLFLFPANATSFYRYNKGWQEIYKREFSARAKKKIREAFRQALRDIRYVPHVPHLVYPKTYGPVLEDRGTEITFSALGQQAPLARKEEWDRRHEMRFKLMRALRKYLPEFEIRSGGHTSIDVTQKGIDKAYGVRQISKTLKMPIKKMIFVGDALYPGGNDYAAKKTGIECLQVSGPEETNQIIKFLI